MHVHELIDTYLLLFVFIFYKCINYFGCRFEPDMLAFSGCYYGGGEKERRELGEIRKRWATLPVSSIPSVFEFFTHFNDFKNFLKYCFFMNSVYHIRGHV